MKTDPQGPSIETQSPRPSRAEGVDAGSERRGLTAFLRPEWAIPLAYAALAMLWIAVSDQLVALAASTPAQQVAWSMAKGCLFILATAALLHLGIRRALHRERRTSRRLAESEALLRAIADATPDPLFLKDRDSRWQFANRATLEAVGKPPRELLGRTDLEIYPDPQLASALMAADRRVVDSGREEVFEERVETTSGVRLFLSTKAPFRDAAGRIVGVVGNARDITDRKHVEDMLHEREERFRALIEKSTDMFIVLDGEGVFRFWSQSAAERMGWSPAAVLGRSALALIHPDDRPRIAGAMRDLVGAAGAIATELFRARRKDGAWRQLEGTARNLLRDPAVGGIVVNCRDVTDQRLLEEQLRQAQKLESVGRLAGGVAHDFNNLLTVILSCAESLEDEVARGLPASAEELHEIRAAGQRASDLTRQLLAFARKQVIAPVTVDLNRVVRGSETLLRRLLGEDVELVVSLDPDLWHVRCDPSQIEQVILNLAVNARDAMPGGGILRIDTANATSCAEDRNAPDGDRGRRVAGEYVRLGVRDSGVGMTSEVQEHLFEPFFTTKPMGRGTGLGLATSYGIVKQSGGCIHVESELGRGTAFEVCLPRSLEPGAPQPAPEPASTGGTEPVLVVEDDAQVREVTVRALRAGGYDVSVAASPQEALDLPAPELARVRLLVTDVVMPGLSGRALADALRSRHPALRVLFVSGYTQDVIAARGVLDSGIEFMGKPFTGPSLLRRVRAILDAA